MNGLTDAQLLRDYAERRAEAAFGELVRRHVDLVYSAALRMVREAPLAEDVAQGVFLALARSADQLTDCPVLSGWLHRTTRNLAANAVRSEVRRRAREEEAAVMNQLLSTEAKPAWEEVAAQLDAVLGELSEPDRDALLLRYFERKSAREMAQTLGTSEEAAQKRVSRAVDRMRELLAERGVTAGAAGLVVLLSANAVQAAPAGLALSITTSAALAGTGAATLTASTAAKTLAMTTLQKTLIATTLAAAIGVGTYEARQASLLRAQLKTLQQQPAVPQPQPPTGPASVDLQNKTVDLQHKVQALETQKNELDKALIRVRAKSARLETEREQVRRSAALYKELVEQTSSKDMNPTNAYPTERHVWVGFGRMGRLAALAKDDESKLSPEEKSALEEAQIKALAEVPTMLKAMKQYEAAKPSGAGQQTDEERLDGFACIFYGALNLDEQQFNQVYGVMEKIWQQAKQAGFSKDTPAPEAAEISKHLMEQLKAETQPLLTPEQNRIFAEVLTHCQIGPGNWGYSATF